MYHFEKVVISMTIDITVKESEEFSLGLSGGINKSL
jgi:hypothetical protein